MKEPDLTRLQSPHFDKLLNFQPQDVSIGRYVLGKHRGKFTHLPCKFTPEDRKQIANCIQHIAGVTK